MVAEGLNFSFSFAFEGVSLRLEVFNEFGNELINMRLALNIVVIDLLHGCELLDVADLG